MIITAVVAALTFAGIATVLFQAYRNSLARARENEAQFTTKLVVDRDGRSVPIAIDPDARVEINDVSQALHQAIEALRAVWAKGVILDVLVNSRIRVKSVPVWRDLWGRQVAGLLLDDGTIVVGSDLKALAHEIAHAVERRADRTDDHDHVRWEAKGITAALEAYRVTLKR